MFAIIEAGGKQYRVKPGAKVKIEKIAPGKRGNLTFEKVLMVSDGKTVTFGTPYVKDARVTAKVVQEGKMDKIIVFRYHNKTRYRKKKGHRQSFSEIEVTKISS